MKRRSIRLAAIQPILSPVRRPLWEMVSADPGIDLRVFVLAAEMEHRRGWSVEKDEAFDVDVVGGVQRRVRFGSAGGRPGSETRVWSPRLPVRVARWKPDVILCTSVTEFAQLLPVRATSQCRIGGIVADTPGTAEHYRGLRRRLRAWAYRHMDFHLPYGRAARDYLGACGIDTTDMRTARWSIDLSRFARNGGDVRGTPRMRTEWLTVGQLVDRKGFSELLAAWGKQSDEFLQWNRLTIVGDGPLEDHYRSLISVRLPNGSARVVGFRTPDELLDIYADSNVFIFPTLRDCWGLVVNEAMAAGLPVLCSRYAGCHHDLITPSNGIVFDPLDGPGLARTIREFAEARSRWPAMGARSAAIAQNYSIRATADAIRDSVLGG